MSNNHVIGKQLWELQLGSSMEVYALQQQVSNMVWNALVPELILMFDRIAGEDEVVVLDRVIVDLGLISPGALATDQLVNRILRDLEDHCFRSRFLPRSRQSGDDRGLTDTNSQPLGKYYFDLWLHWLRYGVLPPYATKPESTWMEQVLETLGITYRASEELEEVLRNYPLALKRLVWQHSAQDLKSLTELFTGYKQNSLLEVLSELKHFTDEALLAATGAYRGLETTFWTEIFQWAILRRKKADSHTLLMHLSLLPWLANAGGQESLSGKGYKLLRKLLEEYNAFPQPPRQDPGTIVNAPAEPKDEETVMDTKVEMEQQLHFFGNAGMVLLHPFLKQFFGRMQLLEENLFKDTESQSRAVLLLHFLATGQDKVREFEMLLPKFLCGMPANQPMDHTLVLSELEKEAAQSLLWAVVAHWGALGNTSPDGLREGFLIREGKLEKSQAGWKLHVEQKAIDVLLDRLPWTLSMVKLTWMPDILRVEWR